MFSMALALVVQLGCTPGVDDETVDRPYTGPGSTAWGLDDISCASNADCLVGEACEEGYCRVDRCGADLADSYPPLGDGYVFAPEEEIALADSAKYDGEYWIDAFDRSSSDYTGGWGISSTPIADVAGGALTGAGPQQYVVAVQGKDKIFLPSMNEWVDFPVTPVALAVGDIDLDGVDEVGGISQSGEIVFCGLDDGSCISYGWSGGVTVLDMAMGDMDADAHAEAVVLLESGGETYAYVLNMDADLTGQVESQSFALGSDGDLRVTVGDLDGDWAAEIIILDEQGGWDMWDDHLRVLQMDPSGGDSLIEVADYEMDDHSEMVDLEAVDTDMDGVHEIFVLGADAVVTTYEYSGMSFSQTAEVTYSPSVSPDRIAAADLDGDSPAAVLVAGPEPQQGRALPMVLMLLPPYEEGHSDGDSSVFFGTGKGTSESHSESVSMGVGMDVGVSGGMDGIFKAKYSTSVSWRVSQTTSVGETIYVSSRYSLSADPEQYGPHYGGVVLGWGCFDAYSYKINDPTGELGGHGETMVITVPTGGGSSIWSTHRYNAMAETWQDMPVIEVPYQVGTVDSYPTQAQDLHGNNLTLNDLVFTNPDTLTVSDVGDVGFYSRVSEEETNSQAMDYSLGQSAGVNVSGIDVGVHGDAGWGDGYSLRVGTDALFGGKIPPIPDNTSTPEDEYGVYGYAFTPWIFLQSYGDKDGNEAAFYVVSYSVDK